MVRRAAAFTTTLAAVVLVCSTPAIGQTFTWDGEGGDGFWSTAANWDPNGVPTGPGDGAIIDAPGPTFQDFSYQIGALIVRPGGTLGILRPARLSFGSVSTCFANQGGDIFVLGQLDLGGTCDNMGYLFLASDAPASTAVLEVQEFGATLDGGGEVEMGFRSEIRGAGGGAARLFVDEQLINGFGTIRADVVVQPAGAIIAKTDEQSLSMLPPIGSVGSQNRGSLSASELGTLRLFNIALDNTGGVISATANSEVWLEDPVISGGRLQTTGNGVIRVPATSAASLTNVRIDDDPAQPDHVDLFVGNRSDLTIGGTIDNQAEIEIFNNSAFVNNVIVSPSGALLQGGGRITLTGDNVGFRGAIGAFLTVRSQLIEGQGFVGQNTINFNVEAGGDIIANVEGETMILDPQTLVDNNGRLSAEGGGTLQLGTGNLANNGQLQAFDGTVLGPATLTNNDAGVLDGGLYRVVNATRNASMALSGPEVTQIGENTSVFLFGMDSALRFGGVLLEASIEQIDGLFELTGRDFIRTAAGPLGVNGVLRILGDATFTVGGMLVVGETGSVNGDGTVVADSVDSGGAVSPGASPGTLLFISDVTLDSTSQLDIELGGTMPGTGFDVVQVDGALVLGGALNVSLIDGFVPAPDDRFEVVTATGLSGTFSNVGGDEVVLTGDGRGELTVTYEADKVVLSDYRLTPTLFRDGFEDK